MEIKEVRGRERQPCRPHFHQARDNAIWLRQCSCATFPASVPASSGHKTYLRSRGLSLNCTQSCEGNVGIQKLGWLAGGLNRHRLGVKLPAEVLRLEEFGWATSGPQRPRRGFHLDSGRFNLPAVSEIKPNSRAESDGRRSPIDSMSRSAFCIWSRCLGPIVTQDRPQYHLDSCLCPSGAQA